MSKVLRHGKWRDVFSGASYRCGNRALPGYCEATGMHLAQRCGIAHKGLDAGETCQAVRVLCRLHPSRIHRDLEQEDRL